MYWRTYGVSYLLDITTENKKRKILFDTGRTGKPVLYNMNQMNVNIQEIEAIFLSHTDRDHTGGLIEVLKKINKKIPVIAHPRIFKKCWRKGEPAHELGSLFKKEAEKYGAEWFLTRKPVKLLNGVVTTGEILKKERENFEQRCWYKRGDIYTIDDDGNVVVDERLDDVSIGINSKKGLVVITGCSHAGLISIIKRSKMLTKSQNIYAVIGGYHLINCDYDRIRKTIEGLKKMNIEKIITGHCTGFKAEFELFKCYKKRFDKLQSGMIINF